jgi:xylulokinase
MSAASVLVGIDIGQTACKAVALQPGRGVLATSSRVHPSSQPRRGWAEQDPDDWLAGVAAACREVLDAVGRDVAAVAVTAATHNAVLVDGAGTPVRPCITLRDQRAADQAERLNRELGVALLRRARNCASPGWTAPALAWVREHEPSVWARTRGILFAKDYVRCWLTGVPGAGEACTDHIDAEGSLLFNALRREWDPLLCDAVPVDPRWLPRVLAPCDLAGHVAPRAAASTGLPTGTPVVVGCSDTAAEALAAGAVTPGQGVVKVATAGNLNVVADRARPSPAYFCYSHPVEGLVYHSYGTNAAAASRAWLQELLGAVAGADYERLDEQASAVPPGADGLLFHPYLFGERAPVFDGSLRASFIGLSGRHGPAHLLRAVLEGVALSLADCALAADRAGLAIDDLRVIGGGARSRLWRQIVADALGRPLLVPALGDASAGAALLAGVGAGWFAGPLEAARECCSVIAEVAPDPGRAAGYADLLAIYREARDSIAPLVRALAEVDFHGAPPPDRALR